MTGIGPDCPLHNCVRHIPIGRVAVVVVEDAVDPGVAVILVGRIVVHVCEWQAVPVVLHVHPPGQHQLAVVVHAHNALRLGLGLGQRGQQQSRQDGDDGNDDEQFDEGKGARLFADAPVR